MTTKTPLELAYWVWLKSGQMSKKNKIKYAQELVDTGVFSGLSAALIVDINRYYVEKLSGNAGKRVGGRFNPEALPQLLDLKLEWDQGLPANRSLIRVVSNQGVSANMISRLTGIPSRTIYRYNKEDKNNGNQS